MFPKLVPDSDPPQYTVQLTITKQTAAKLRFLASVANMSPTAFAEAVFTATIEHQYDFCNPTRPPRN